MKKIVFILAMALMASLQTWAQDTIHLTWKGSTSEKTIKVRATAGIGNITVNWGDKTAPASYNGKGTTDVSLPYTYADTNNYNVLITTAGANTKFTKLDCSKNQLTALDVSKSTALTDLGCGYNQLTALDVSQNTVLTDLSCYDNQLTTLDVSQNTKLIDLNCSYNPFTTLDLSKNTALTELFCFSTQLTTLDLSQNTKLTWLSCSNNQFTALDVSQNTELTYLSCPTNQLTALDLSTNTKLKSLYCNSNQLTALDLSKNTELTTLDCNNNQLTTLDLSKNTKLTSLTCYSTPLTALNLSKNTKLTSLSCVSTSLTALDLSKNTELTSLTCGFNPLTALDLSKNTELKTLSCNSSQLTALDLSMNTKLTTLRCYSNQLTTLDLSKNTELTTLYCYYNQLTALDLSKNTKLTTLDCLSNQLPLSQLYPIWMNKGISKTKSTYPQYIYDTVPQNRAIDLSSEMEFGSPAAQTKFTIYRGTTGSVSATGKYTFAEGMLTFTELGDYRVEMKNDSVREGAKEPGVIVTVTAYYHVREARSNANLASLSVSQGELQPAFSAGVTEYTLNTTLCSGTEISITATPEDNKATVAGNLSNHLLAISDTTLVIAVTADDGATEKEYKINLTVKSSYKTPLADVSICQGEMYNFRGKELRTSGTYGDTLHAVNGCDSIIVLKLTVNPTHETPVAASICKGATYDFFGRQLTTAGTYREPLKNIYGCDSVIVLTLTVNPSPTTAIADTICEGGSRIFYERTLTAAGVYNKTLQTIHGCDSTIVLTLTVNPVFSFAETHTICEGESYQWQGKTYNEAGEYEEKYSTVNGCDSIYKLTLTVASTYETMLPAATICQGETYNLNSKQLTEAGLHKDTLQSIHGCDSVVMLMLTVNPVYSFAEAKTICAGDSYQWQGTEYSESGTYTKNYTTVNGCDSTYKLTLTVAPVYETELPSAVICQGKTYNFNGELLTLSGEYRDTLQSIHGCDSIVKLSLTVNPSYEIPLADVSICEGATYNFRGKELSTSGTYKDTLQTVNGCDSIIALTLTVNPKAITYITDSICEGGTYNFNGESLTKENIYKDTLQTIHGCDSVIVLTLKVNPVYTIEETETICVGKSYQWHGKTYDKAGSYEAKYTTVHGCDSIYKLTLSIAPTHETMLPAVTICKGNSYDFGGKQRNETGVYRDTLQSIHGCDSILVLLLTVTNSIESSIEASICQGIAYDFNGKQYTSAGVYPDTLISSFGCDSIVTLTLTVNPTFEAPAFEASICQGAAYDFNGKQYTASGEHRDTLQSIYGCDSILVLKLTVNPTFEAPAFEASICQGAAYDFNGKQYTASGEHRDTLQSIHGCDSILVLKLTVNPVFETPLADTLIEGTTYDFYGESLTTAGEYKHTLQTVHGCDSVIVLTLTVTPKVSIKQITKATFTVYPNPTSGQLTVDNGQLIINKVEIFDINGRKLSTINNQQSTAKLDLSGYANGVYLLRINDEQTVKVVKE
ncbi:T9SS type A sorting domain-containing protein [Bacteroidales bacterium OttesenSCG-928-C19]|nr:T9SS type A sorting domain-containing protein [Bacteroidales bacterium OttesenSCG-928-C19]